MDVDPVEILGVQIDPVTYPGVMARISDWLKTDRQYQVVTINPEFIMASQSDPEFKDILNHAALRVPDGIGLLWASNLGGKPIKNRVTGTDLVEKLVEVGEKANWRFFFLGGKEGSGEKASKLLKIRYPNLAIAGSFEGDGSISGDSQTVAAVKKAGAIDLLLVAYGHPKQEKWLKRNLGKTNAKVGIGVGGAFDFLSGKSKRAPEWVRQSGFEWLYRLVREPWRFRRQLALPKFAYLILKERFSS